MSTSSHRRRGCRPRANRCSATASRRRPAEKRRTKPRSLLAAAPRVFLVSRLGDDANGDLLRRALGDAGVSLDHVATDDAATGASTVFAADGDYASIIVPGAAGRLSTADIDAAAETIRAADALLLQFEVDLEVSAAAAAIAGETSTSVVLNASPEPPVWALLPGALRDATTMLVVNEAEAHRLLNSEMLASENLPAALRATVGDKQIVMTRGKDGALLLDATRTTAAPSFHAEVIDAVGAGDAFLGAFLAARLSGASREDAARRAAAAGAIAVTRPGAFHAQPSAAEIDAFLSTPPE